MNEVVKTVVVPVEDEAYEYNSHPKLEVYSYCVPLVNLRGFGFHEGKTDNTDINNFNNNCEARFNNMVESLNRPLMIFDWNNTKSGCQIEEIDQPGSSMSKDSCEMSDERSVVTGTAGPLTLYRHNIMHENKMPLAEVLRHKSFACKHASFKTKFTCRKFRREARYYKSGIIALISDELLRSVTTVNNTEMVQRMLTQGVSPNNKDKKGRTPLHVASERGYTEIVRILLKNGADPNCQDYSGTTPLHLAVESSKKLVVAFLLEAGANPLLCNKKYESALQFARMKLLTVRSYNNDYMLRMNTEINDIINMLLVAINHRQGFGEQIDTLSNVCSRLTLSNAIN